MGKWLKKFMPELIDHATDTLDTLSTMSRVSVRGDSTLEEFEERAAIMEYDAGLTREEAEAQALHNVIYMKDYQHDRN
jgi:hypothetical protein